MCAHACVCLQGELRCWDPAPLLFNEHLWRRQVHVEPLFVQLSSTRPGRLALPPHRPLAKAHRQQQQQQRHTANGRAWNTSEILASHPRQPLKERKKMCVTAAVCLFPDGLESGDYSAALERLFLEPPFVLQKLICTNKHSWTDL